MLLIRLIALFPLLIPGQILAEDNPSSNADSEPVYIPVNDILLTDDTLPIPESETEETSQATTSTNETSDIEQIYDLGEPENPPFFSFLDEHQQLISSRLQQYVLGIDNFFTDSTSIEKRTGSYLRIQLGVLWPEREGLEFDGGISLRLRLPKTQEKMKLVIASDPDEQKSSLERETGVTSSTDSGGLYTGIEKDLGDDRKWRIRPSIGIKIRSPLDWYARVKGNREILFDKWNLGIYQNFYWFDSSGFGSETTMRWDRAFSDKFLFRSESFVRYTDLNDYFDMSQTFSIIHTLSMKRAITYKVGVFGQSEQPAFHATDYLINALYRSNIHKDYLFLDIQPQILFEKENNFDSRLEFLIRLEIFYQG